MPPSATFLDNKLAVRKGYNVNRTTQLMLSWCQESSFNRYGLGVSLC